MAFVVNPSNQTLDILRIVEYPYRGGSPVTRLNLHDDINFALVGGTLKITPPERRQQFSQSNRRYGGDKISTETHGNGQISAEWYIRGTTADLSMELSEQFLTEIERIDERSPRYIAWQPAGAARPVMYRIVGPANWEPMYRWIEFKQNRVLHMAAGIAVAPLAEGLPMFIADRFDTDSTADYITDVGSASDWEVNAGGYLRQIAGFAADKDIIHADRNYLYGDHEGTIKLTVGTTPSGVRAGVILKGKDSQNKIRVYFRQTPTVAGIYIDTMVGNVVTAQGNVLLPAVPVAGDTIWVRGWTERNRVYGALWVGGNYPEAEPDIAMNHTLSSGNAAVFGFQQYGRTGIHFRWPDNTSRIEEYSNRTFHYKGGGIGVSQSSPASIPLDGPIPGSAPAKADVDVILTASSVIAPFAVIAWAPEFDPFNFIWNGDFEDDVDGWSVAAPAGSLHGAGTSFTRITTDKFAGLASAQVNLPATNNTGVHFKLWRAFLRGVTYTVKFRVKATSGSPSVQVGLGYDTSNFGGSGAQTISSTAWTELTATWTPTSEFDFAFAFLRSETATAMNIIIDTARVYIGTTESTTRAQTDGRGAPPPFGVLKALGRDASRSTGWTTPAESATYIHNNTLNSASLEFLVDPSLLPSDPYSEGETTVEVWARMSVNDADLTVTAQAIPGNVTLPAGWRTTNEYGSSGKRVKAMGTSGTDWRVVRLGTLNFKPIYGDSSRWRIRVSFAKIGTTSAGVKVEEFYLTPIRRRALTPTGKPLDAAYPYFMGNTNGHKRIYSDLRGAATTLPSAGFFPDSGLGGEFIELEPGNNRLFVKLSNKIPDNPTVEATPAETSPLPARFYVDITPRYFLGRG